MNYGKNTD